MAHRTQRGSGSVYWDEKANAWVGRLSVTVDGKRQQPSVTGHTQTEARNKMNQLRHKITSGEVVLKRSRESVEGYLIQWLDKSNFTLATRTRYHYLIKTVLTYRWFAELRLTDTTRAHVTELYGSMKDDVSNSQQVGVHQVLRLAFEDARLLNIIMLNPADVSKRVKPKYIHKPTKSFDEQQEATFSNAIKGDRLESLYIFALDTGARQSEITALQWDAVDLQTGVVRLHRNLTGTGKLRQEGPLKGKKEHSLPVAPTTLTLLRQMREVNPSQELVFPNLAGNHIHPQSLDTSWKLLLGKIGFGEKFTFHVLRHTSATMLLRAGVSLATVSKRLGHANITTTLKYYAHALPQDDDRAAGVFEQRFASYRAVESAVKH